MDNKMTAEKALEFLKNKQVPVMVRDETGAVLHRHGRMEELYPDVFAALSAPRVPDLIATSKRLPDHSIPVFGFNPDWIDDDFNAHGVRECFVTGDGTEWVCARWNGYHDCYDTVQGEAPTHWMPYPAIGEVAASPEPVAQTTEQDKGKMVGMSVGRISNEHHYACREIVAERDDLRAEVEALRASKKELVIEALERMESRLLQERMRTIIGINDPDPVGGVITALRREIRHLREGGEESLTARLREGGA